MQKTSDCRFIIPQILWEGGVLRKIPFHNGTGTARLADRFVRIQRKRRNAASSSCVRVAIVSSDGLLCSSSEFAWFPLTFAWREATWDKAGGEVIHHGAWREIPFSNVLDIKSGFQTRTFWARAAKSGSNELPPSSNCFSLLCRDRTIDFCAKSVEDAKVWCKALCEVLEQIKSSASIYSDQHQGLQLQKKNNHHSSFGNPIWNGHTFNPLPVSIQSTNEERLYSVRGHLGGKSSRTKWQCEKIIKPLFMAVRQGNVGIVRDFLINGCPVDIAEDKHSGDTIIIVACQYGKRNIVKLALEWQAKNDPHPEHGQTALQVAVSNGNIDCARLILETAAPTGSDIVIVNHEDHNKLAPILVASLSGNLEILKLLLSHGADISSIDSFGRTCVHIASMKGHRCCLLYLFDIGADFLVDERDNDGYTSLHLAIKYNRAECVNILLEAAADYRLLAPGSGTAYEFAIHLGRHKIANTILIFDEDARMRLHLFEQINEEELASSAPRKSHHVHEKKKRQGICYSSVVPSPQARHGHNTETLETRKINHDAEMIITENKNEQDPNKGKPFFFMSPKSTSAMPLVSARDTARLQYFGSQLRQRSDSPRCSDCSVESRNVEITFTFEGDLWYQYFHCGLPYFFRHRDNYSTWEDPRSADDWISIPSWLPSPSHSQRTEQSLISYLPRPPSVIPIEKGKLLPPPIVCSDTLRSLQSHDSIQKKQFVSKMLPHSSNSTNLNGICHTPKTVISNDKYDDQYETPANKQRESQRNTIFAAPDFNPSAAGETTLQCKACSFDDSKDNDFQTKKKHIMDTLDSKPCQIVSDAKIDDVNMAVTEIHSPLPAEIQHNTETEHILELKQKHLKRKEDINNAVKNDEANHISNQRAMLLTELRKKVDVDSTCDGNSHISMVPLEKENECIQTRVTSVLTEQCNLKKYSKMVKVGVPFESVIQKMSSDNVATSQIERFRDSSAREFMKESSYAKTKNTSSQIVTRTHQISNKKQTVEPKYSKYFNMVKVGVPFPAIVLKMKQDGVSENESANFCTIANICDDSRTSDFVPTTSESSNAVQMDHALAKYFKMVKVGVPITSILHKMVNEGVTNEQIIQFRKINNIDEEPTTTSVAACSSTRRTSVKMQKVHWNTVDNEKLHNSLWAHDTPDEINEEEIIHLEELFCDKSASKLFVRKSSGEVNRRSSHSYITFIDTKRGNNIAIALAQFRDFQTYGDLCHAVESMNDNKLDSEKLQNMSLLLPTHDEELKIKKYSGNGEGLGRAEQWFLSVSKIKRFQQKLDLFLFSQQFDEQVTEMKRTLLVLNCAYGELLENQQLASVLRKILAVGNVMNEAAGKVRANGITLESLLKASKKKGTDGKTTILDHVVAMISKNPENESNPLNFWTKMKNAREATRINLRDIENGLKDIRRRLNKAERTIMEEESDCETILNYSNNGVKQFLRKGKLFVCNATESLSELHSLTRLSSEATIKLCAYFAEDPETSDTMNIFRVLITFADQVKNSQQALERRIRSSRRNSSKSLLLEENRGKLFNLL